MRFWKRRLPPPVQSAPGPHPAVEQTQDLIRANDLDAAQAILDAALTQTPEEPELLVLRSELHRRQRKPEAGIACCERALLAAARPAIVHFELAECHLALSALSPALDALNVAVTLDPHLALAWYRLGESLLRVDQYDDALVALHQSLDTAQDDALRSKTHYQIGRCHFVQSRIESALAAFQACLALDPGHAVAMISLGHAYLRLDQDAQAIDAYEKALGLIETPSDTLLLNLGSARQHCGHYAAARDAFQQVLTRHPSDHQARWYLCQLDLLECRWEQGWTNYSARFAAGASPFRPMPYRRWNGQTLPEDTLLVLADQGLGDEIMFASCLADTARRVGHVIVECEPRLERLFRRSFPELEIIATQRENQADWLASSRSPQWQIPSGDLPTFFRRTDGDFPRHSGFLHADPERIAHWRDRLQRATGSGGLKVGLSWRGGTDRTRTRARTVSTEHWQPILNVPGVHFVNLQYGDYHAELGQFERTHGLTIHDFPEAQVDYDETAALVGALDLVVTVCTSIVHLSGALGKPVWVLTPFAPGWRYTAHRDSLPWYPSSRIFRQGQLGDWATTCRELAAALQGLTR